MLHETRVQNPEIPIVVHCSAGIGRTGTLLSIYNIQQLLRDPSSSLDDCTKDSCQCNCLVRVSVFGTVRRLREQRWGMVNNPVSRLNLNEVLGSIFFHLQIYLRQN